MLLYLCHDPRKFAVQWRTDLLRGENLKGMREIKFRVWYEGKMHYNAICGNGQALFIHDATGEYKWISLAECKVMQFTGLHDKNGKEIYEGDVCTKMISPDEDNLAPKELHRGIIVFHYGGFCYKSGDYYYPMSRTHGVINVIGNIYER